MTKQQIHKIIVTLATAIVTCAAIALGLTSCNVTRTITTQSQYYQRGDTACTIVTKTIEQYDIVVSENTFLVRRLGETLKTARRPCSHGTGKFVVLNMISNTDKFSTGSPAGGKPPVGESGAALSIYYLNVV